ncbi:uncharacterized protein [Haliotis asinina]|uniref:uncharacterized protein isoform X2 n=1 Tax=Haliotis asinina TaxID=109174 RepID=UPI00353194C5
MDVHMILIVAVRLLSTQGSTVHVLRLGLSTGYVLLIVGIVCIFVLCFRHRRQTAERDHQRGETIHVYRSGLLETGEYFPVHQYWDIDDYDEVSQLQEQQQREEEYYDDVSQQQGPAEGKDYDEVTERQGQQQGPVEKEDYDEVSQQQRQQEPTLEVVEVYNSNPAFPALVGHFPGPRGIEDDDSDSVLPVLADYHPGDRDTEDNNGSEDDDSDSVLPVLADYYPGAQDTEDNNGSEDDDSDSLLLVLADYYPGAQDTEDNNGSDTSHSSVSASQSYTHLIRDVFVDNPRTVVTYLSPTEDLE